MRSSRQSHLDQNRRSDYHYHSSSNRGSSSSSSSSQSNHLDSNGHSNTLTINNSEQQYRSSKRSSSNLSSSNLIKRMKNTTPLPNNSNNNNNSNNDNSNSSIINNNNNSTRNTREFVNTKPSKISAANHPSSSKINNFIKIDTNECNQFTLNGYNQEEIEALSGPCLEEKAVNDFEKFQTATSNLRELIRKMLETKKSKHKNIVNDVDDEHSSGTSTNDNAISDIKVKGLMCLMEMKTLNRLDKYRLKEARKKISTNKDRIDRIHLKLQNIQYEVMHLQKEQISCSSFRSKDEFLSLVDEDKFINSEDFPQELRHLLTESVVENGESITKTLQFNKQLAKSEDLHKFHSARLDWELKQRIAANDQLNYLEKSKYDLEEEIVKKKQTYSLFATTLKNIIEAAKPLESLY